MEITNRAAEELYRKIGIDISLRSSGGEQRVVCPKCPPHKSGRNTDKDLSVNTEKHVWQCHRCGWSGSVKSYIKGETFVPVKVKPQTAPSNEMYRFFSARGISQIIVDRNNIKLEKGVFFPGVNKEKNAIAFNYYFGDKLVNVKYRSAEKDFAQSKGGAKVFYKINDIYAKPEVIITEGEIDALSYEQAGYNNAISVPDGGINPDAKVIDAKMSFLDNTIELFDHVKKIYLSLDNDAVGLRMQEELARRFGKYRCYIVQYPANAKDANEVLTRYGADALKHCIESAEPYPVEGVYNVMSAAAELDDLYENGFPAGAKAVIGNLAEYIRFYPKQLTIVTGIPSHGKSGFIDQVMIKLAASDDWRWAVFSPENATVELHSYKLIELIVGKTFLPNYNNRMSREEMEEARSFLNEHVYFIKPKDEKYTLDAILENIAYLVKMVGINGAVIDPWNTVEHQYSGESETQYTARALNKLKYFAREHDLHLFLVAHPTKMRKEREESKKHNYEIPTLYDVAGSAHHYNVTDNGVCVYRLFSSDGEGSTPYVYIQKVKHRFVGRIGAVKLQYDIPTHRYYGARETNYGNILRGQTAGGVIPGVDYPAYWDDDNEDSNF